MKYGVIDIGSNSIRLMMSDGINTLSKELETTQLAQRLAITGELCEEAMARSIEAIERLYNKGLQSGASIVYVFATEAVRSASNRQEFVNRLSKRGINVEIVPADQEGRLGFAGAYVSGKVAVLDIGGASTELTVGDENGIYYSKSIPIGIVRIKDNCHEDPKLMQEYINTMVQKYGEVPAFDEILAIGGTASSFVSISTKMAVYDTKKVDFYKLHYSEIENSVKYVQSVPFDERGSIVGLSLKRIDVIVGGGLLLMHIMKKFNKDYVIVRESDNQEGFLKYKLNNV